MYLPGVYMHEVTQRVDSSTVPGNSALLLGLKLLQPTNQPTRAH